MARPSFKPTETKKYYEKIMDKVPHFRFYSGPQANNDQMKRHPGV